VFVIAAVGEQIALSYYILTYTFSFGANPTPFIITNGPKVPSVFLTGSILVILGAVLIT